MAVPKIFGYVRKMSYLCKIFTRKYLISNEKNITKYDD